MPRAATLSCLRLGQRGASLRQLELCLAAPLVQRWLLEAERTRFARAPAARRACRRLLNCGLGTRLGRCPCALCRPSARRVRAGARRAARPRPPAAALSRSVDFWRSLTNAIADHARDQHWIKPVLDGALHSGTIELCSFARNARVQEWLLVELGADVDCWRFRVAQYGGPPLYEAVVRRDYPMMSMLIDLGADPTVLNSDNAETAMGPRTSTRGRPARFCCARCARVRAVCYRSARSATRRCSSRLAARSSSGACPTTPRIQTGPPASISNTRSACGKLSAIQRLSGVSRRAEVARCSASP